VASHNFSGPLSAVISAHFASVVPNFRIMEGGSGVKAAG
jgi:hypothetical protein